MNIKIALLTIVLLTIIQLVMIIRLRIKIKFLTKLTKNPSLLDDYRWYAKHLKTKPLTNNEKRKAFEKVILKEEKCIKEKF